MEFTATKCPTDELSLTNCAVVNPSDFDNSVNHILVHTSGGQNFAFSIKRHHEVPRLHVGFSLPQRKWAVLSINQKIEVHPYHPQDYVSSITFEVDFMPKKVSSGVNPRIINRSVNLARSQPTIDTADIDPPYLRLSSEQPNIPIKNVDVTRRPQAFGRWALAKIRRELHSKDKTITIQAINTLMDEMHNPLKAYEAFRLRIPQRMFDLLLSKSKEIRECCLMALSVMVGLADGREILVNNRTFLENLAAVIEDPSPAVRVKAATLMELVSKTWMAAYELVSTAFVPVLLDNLLNEEEVIAALHLKSLANLFHSEGRVFALKYGAFEIMNELLERSDPKILSGAANCVGFLAMDRQGKEIAFNIDILVKLSRLLRDERSEVFSAAAFAIMNCTLLTKAKLRAYEIKGLHERLFALSTGSELAEARIHSLQAATNICEHPCIRKKISNKLFKITKRVGINVL